MKPGYLQKVHAWKKPALERHADIAVDAMSFGGLTNHRKPEKKRGLWLK